MNYTVPANDLYFLRVDLLRTGDNKLIRYNISYGCNYPVASYQSWGTFRANYSGFDALAFYGDLSLDYAYKVTKASTSSVSNRLG